MTEVDGEAKPLFEATDAAHMYERGVRVLDAADGMRDPQAPPLAQSVLELRYLEATALFAGSAAAAALGR